MGAILTAAGIPEDALVGRHGRPVHDAVVVIGSRHCLKWLRCGAVLCRHCFHGDTDPRPVMVWPTLQWWLAIEFAQACKWLEGWLGLMPSYRCWHAPASPVQTVLASRAG